MADYFRYENDFVRLVYAPSDDNVQQPQQNPMQPSPMPQQTGMVTLQKKKSGGLFDQKFSQLIEELQTHLSATAANKTPTSATFKVEADPKVVKQYLSSLGFVSEDSTTEMSESLRLENFFFESTYRSAEYWEPITSALGKTKKEVLEQDILNLRQTWVLKPKNSIRDEMLQSLDSAARYFKKRITKEGNESKANAFYERYKAIGDLTPDDYNDEAKLDSAEEGVFDTNKPHGISFPPSQNALNFSGLFTK